MKNPGCRELGKNRAVFAIQKAVAGVPLP